MKNQEIKENYLLINTKDNYQKRMLTIEELLRYKIYKCERQNCRHKPRDRIIKNKYHDEELQCNGYHNNKDKRRIVID